MRRPHESSHAKRGHVLALAERSLGQTEVDDLGDHLIVFVDEHKVRGLDIAMHEAVLRGGIQRACHLGGDLQRYFRGQRAFPLDDSLQSLAIDKLHGVKPCVPLGAQVEHGRHVPMAQLRGGARLADESLPRHVAVQVRGVDDFQADRKPQARVERLVGDAHSPPPQLEERAVVTGQNLVMVKRGNLGHEIVSGNNAQTIEKLQFFRASAICNV